MGRLPKRETLAMNQTLAALAIEALGDEAWGGQIYEHLLGISVEPMSKSAVYLALDDLETKGYAESWIVPPPQGQGGRPRKYYRLTDPEGMAALRNTLDALSRAGTTTTRAVLNPVKAAR